MADNGKGWIKLHRSLRDNILWTDSAPFDDRSAWVDLLMMVNHDARELIIGRKIISVKPGQTWTSIQHLAARWHWSREKTYRYIKMLKNLKMIHTDATPSGTLLTLVNWAFYNGERNTNETTNETTDKTTGETTDETQTRIYKNDIKNDKEDSPLTPQGGSARRTREWQ
jgi:DNA replication protein DnaD